MLDFWLQNLAFATYVLFAFVCLAISWLHWDTGEVDRKRDDILKFAGFGLLGMGFLLKIFAGTDARIAAVMFGVDVIALLLIAFAIKTEPILPSKLSELLPEHKAPEQPVAQPQTSVPAAATQPAVSNNSVETTTVTPEPTAPAQAKGGQIFSIFPIVALALPVLSGLIALVTTAMVWKRYRAGKMKEYKWFMIGLGALGVAFVLSGLKVFADSDIILVQTVFSNFGVLWIIQHILIIVAGVSFAKWFGKYVKFRVRPELFVSFATIAVTVSTAAALIFAFFLFSGAQNNLFNQLSKDVQVLNLAVNKLQENALTAANLIAKSDAVITAMQNNNYQALYETGVLYANEAENVDSIIFTDKAAQILVRTDNLSAVGQSLSDDDLVVYALKEGKERVSVITEKGVLADKLAIKAVKPILGKDGNVIGTVETEFIIDDAFADAVKAQTSLEVAIYSGDRRSATTLLAADGKGRRENSVDGNPEVIARVLQGGEVYAGQVMTINESYDGAYAPLKDTNGKVIGMLFVGRPESILLGDLERSLETTFLASVVVSLLSLIPAYYLAKRIEKYRKA